MKAISKISVFASGDPDVCEKFAAMNLTGEKNGLAAHRLSANPSFPDENRYPAPQD
jgi:hypothetical protein